MTRLYGFSSSPCRDSWGRGGRLFSCFSPAAYSGSGGSGFLLSSIAEYFSFGCKSNHSLQFSALFALFLHAFALGGTGPYSIILPVRSMKRKGRNNRKIGDFCRKGREFVNKRCGLEDGAVPACVCGCSIVESRLPFGSFCKSAGGVCDFGDEKKKKN